MSRLSCNAVHLDSGKLLCRVLSRYLCYVDPADTTLTPHLCLNGFWESWITQALSRVATTGQRCIDLGANYGYYSLLMAQAVGPSGHVLAVEPNPRVADLLAQTLELNGFSGWSTIVQAVVTDRSGDQVELFVSRDHAMNASIFGAGQPGAAPIVASTVTVDDLTSEWDRVDLVKVDVEGAEEAAWRGMRMTLSRNQAITVILEFNPARQYDGRALLELMSQEGFRLRHIDYDSHVKDLDVDDCLSRPGDWMLFLRRM